jgi:hypothetical protein
MVMLADSPGEIRLVTEINAGDHLFDPISGAVLTVIGVGYLSQSGRYVIGGESVIGYREFVCNAHNTYFVWR